MLRLPDVTLIALSGIGHRPEEHRLAFEKSREGIEFGAVKHVQLGSVRDIPTWNEAVINELYKYVDTSHCLLIHHDGYVINPDLWKDEWLGYDYAGSPWPLPQDDYSYRDESGGLVRVGNSVSLRSRRLMELAAQRPVEYRYGNNNEDGHICCWNRNWLEANGCLFMPFEEALDFGIEWPLPEHNGRRTFLFHSTS